jgi:integrase
MGLGAFPDVTLADARLRAADMRASLRSGVDPLQARQARAVAAKVAHANARTFKECRDAYIKAHKAAWRNAKHGQQWTNTLDTHAAELLELPVEAIGTPHILGALEPIWTTKTETATRVRQRIESVLDWATARGYRKGENPARWRGHLENLLPEAAKVRKVVPRAALPYGDIPAFWGQLAAIDTVASQALRMQILTATRPSEATGASWSEIDLKAKLWTIPGSRMKAGKDHRVPLSKELVAMLKAVPGREGFVFPGTGRLPGPLTIAAPLKLLKQLRPGLTIHGFRSTFRDWAADQTAHPRDVAEMALAHTIKDKSEAAYRRSDMLERRARLMQDWATYCTTLAVSPRTSPLAR